MDQLGVMLELAPPPQLGLTEEEEEGAEVLEVKLRLKIKH